MSNSTRCAACKYVRRRCCQNCVLAPYFPPNNPQRFAQVHKVFGASKITELLKQLPVHLRSDASECISIEATLRLNDPVYGCVGIISQLQQQIIDVQSELAKVKGEIAFYNAQQQQQPRPDHLQQGIIDTANQRQSELLQFNSSQKDSFDFDQLLLLQANEHQKSHF